MKFIAAGTACGVAALLIAPALRANVAYNNLGPGDSYSSSGYILYGPTSPSPWTQGFRFVSRTSGPVTRVYIPLYHIDGGNLFSFEIYSDAGGTPGTSLGGIGQIPASQDAGAPPIEITAGGNINLVNGSAYWLIGQALGNSQCTWRQNDQGRSGMRAFLNGGLEWSVDTQNLAAFRVEVGPPCPADYDHNGPVEPADIAAFVNVWYTSLSQGTLAGDYNHNGAVDPADVSLFINVWFAALNAGGC